MSLKGSRSGADLGRARSGMGKGRWKMLAATLIIPASVLVAGSVGSAATTHHAATNATKTAHVTYEPMSWFKTQLAKDYSLASVGNFPTSTPAHKKGKKVWVISCGQASTGCALPTANAVASGKLLGWKMTSCDGNFGIADGYNNCIHSAIAAGADGVEVVSTDCNQAYTGMLQLKALGIPLVGSEGFECSEPLGYISNQKVFTGNILYTKAFPTAKALNLQAGREAADYLVVHFNGNVQAINTNFSVVAGEYADLGFVQELSKCQTCKILTTINYSPPDTPAGGTFQTEFASALAANPTANSAYNWPDAIVNEDGMIQAVSSIGKSSTFCIVTSQASAGPSNLQAIAAGNSQCADGAVDVVWNGYAMTDEMIRAFAHAPMAYEGMGPLLISKGHNLGDITQNWRYPFPKFNPVATYKKLWKVK
jgi:ribose transport system substrate-binding protein